MLDEFREQADSGTFLEDTEEEEETRTRRGPSLLTRDRLLGMTSAQRLVIALMLLITTCLISMLCLLATGKIVPPL
ncbi:MAG: hypothetical protein JXA78_08190 [Anaerolineales bacterium]|nr:hypothetical protein [Anaerolineales bacterium]